MARLARFVLPGTPHHVTQRGNGRQQTFFSQDDYAAYRDLLAEHCAANDVAVWSWVLMPNHVHLILVPEHVDSLRAALSKVHRAYAGRIHSREKRTGHFWQGRFGCVAMDEPHLLAALRYVALNPVRAKLVLRPEDWQWSSTSALIAGADDHVVRVAPALERVGDFASFLGEDFDEALGYAALRKAESVGRPVGSAGWLEDMEERAGMRLKPQKRGPKPKVATSSKRQSRLSEAPA